VSSFRSRRRSARPPSDSGAAHISRLLDDILPGLRDLSTTPATTAAATQRGNRKSPSVLLFDDLHWADEPTLQLIQHLAPQK
jgi:hypothetical protein